MPDVLSGMVRNLACCGVKELDGLSGNETEDVVYTVVQSFSGAPYYFFTDNTGQTGSYGDQLKDYIEENHLGEVTMFGPVRSGTSGNMLRFYLWMVNADAIKELATRLANEYLAASNLSIGDVVKCGPTANHFDGRGVIESISGNNVTVLLDDGCAWRLRVNEIGALKKTRRI